jgi:hypothetical protein
MTIAKDVAAGVDPFGVWTTRLAADAERARTSRRKHRTKTLAAAVGGSIGGGVVVPSVVSGVIGAAKGAGGGASFKQRLRGAAKGAVRGAQAPLKNLVQGGKALRTARRAEKKGLAGLSEREIARTRKMIGNLRLSDVYAHRKHMKPTKALMRELRSAKKGDSPARKHVVEQLAGKYKGVPKEKRDEMGKLLLGGSGIVSAARKKGERAFASGVAAMGMAAGVGGGGAALQYQKGREIEQETRRRLREARKRMGDGGKEKQSTALPALTEAAVRSFWQELAQIAA